MVFATLISRSKLTIGHKQIDIIGSNIVLRHSNNSLRERHFAMMIG
jgi:hypothetical protein